VPETSLPEPLKPEALRRQCDPAQFTFETTAELEDLSEIVGQARAVEAVRFGIGIRRRGYNLFALGPAGAGKHFMVRQFIEKKALGEPTPSDWCYVNNFDQPHKPRALRLPPGQGSVLRRDMDQLIEELRSAIPALFETDDYRNRKQVILQELKERQEKAFADLQQQAEQHGIALIRTPDGFAFAPIKEDKVVGPDEYDKLPEEEQKRIEAEIDKLQEQLRQIIHQVPRWEKEGRGRVRELNREVTGLAVGHLIDELRAKYAAYPDVVDYLNAVEREVVENFHDFVVPAEGAADTAFGMPLPRAQMVSPSFRRYQVNVLVDHGETKGAPVVYEDNPSYQNLTGRIEHISQMGTLITDFNLIKAGALHRATGGYLVLDAVRVLLQPFAWEGLKRALRSGEIRIESLGQMLSLVSTVSLEPEAVPLEVKIVLLGERMLYYLLQHYDPEFNELFKVAVDFEDRMERNAENDLLYAGLIATLARKDGLRPFDRGAVARVVEHGARVVGDAEKLSTHVETTVNLLREADYWAEQAGRQVVSAEDVQRAVDTQIHRLSRVRELIQEEIRRGTILIDTAGARVGQINGLSVMDMGHFMFGRPSRITARVRLGKGEVVDIEREVELGGPIHSKGVLILSAFLGARYAPEQPLSLSASLVFEQSYGGVEGDSASSAELYTLLSALADVPIRQSFAVTGSVNQHGEVQAIGGVNEKIEGFFDLCQATGLTGDQGVLIPESNVKHLMLRQDVVQAVAEGKFSVYAVSTIDQGIELLTGMPAGIRNGKGVFPKDSINGRVEARLVALAEQWRASRRARKRGANDQEQH
jgi:lon-related putative ATP-dependent protease